MKQSLSFALFACFIALSPFALAQGDTVVVQTFTFEDQNDPESAYDSPGRRWFQFPEADGTTYQKILMQYTLTCFEDGTAGNLGFPCGEWDYLTYTYLYDHTGTYDSTLTTHPLYLIDNQNLSEFSFTLQPQFHTRQVEQEQMIIDDVLAESEVEVGAAMQLCGDLLTTSELTGKAQMLWTADELVQAGLNAGPIHRLALHTGSIAGDLDMLKIRMAATALTSLDVPLQSGWSDYYFANTPFNEEQWVYLNLLQPYEWDGTSSLAIEFSFTNAGNYGGTELYGSPDNSSRCVVFRGGQRYIDFSWFDEVKVPASAFDGLSDEVTIQFWIKGEPGLQPQNGTVFEGVDAANNRVLNSHLPWGNSRVYWDAGFEGGYDRIDKAAVEANYEGQWNHWAFTKNSNTEQMKIYLNGALWHSGTGKDNLMENIAKFSIGAATGWSNYYNGAIDEFVVFTKELDQTTIGEWMFKRVDASHPNYADLALYYDFDEQNGEPVADVLTEEHRGTVHGSANRELFRGEELFKCWNHPGKRADIRFVRGEYETHLETLLQGYPEPIAPVSMARYEAQGNAAVLSEVSYAWAGGYAYTFNPEGEAIDSILIDTPEYLENESFEFYLPPFEVLNRYELGRFITPYGIGLDMGEAGWTWVFDVTDFAPLLTDSVDLTAGNWQELLDLKFLFITGTPSRDVKRIETLWSGDYALSTFAQNVAERSVQVEPGEAGWRLKTTTSGHQFDNPTNCAEFCYKMQSVEINGSQQYSWQIMQECADNPLYPQGGTWIFDRAGWCPGAPVTTQNLELTPYVSGETFTVDYDSQFDNYGNYVFEGYLIAYGEPNFALDAELQEIIAPSNTKIHSRNNPICSNPVIRIRNSGTQPLTSCTISYGIEGSMESYEWTGDLDFLESEDVELVVQNSAFWNGDEEAYLEFMVELLNPNGMQDPNPYNNAGSSGFYRPPHHSYSELDDNRVIVWIGTNNAPWEISAAIYDRWGNPVFYRDDYPLANTTYRDTIALNQGCYLFHLEDSDDDGLSFFANNDGNGNARLKKVGAGNLKTFDPDFGKEIKYHFYWETNVVSVDEQSASGIDLLVFPNPGEGVFNVELNGLRGKLLVQVFDMTGRLVWEQERFTAEENGMLSLDLSGQSPGLYSLQVSNGKLKGKSLIGLQ
jgi:hypothetical protein